jgi:hypothetical protein
MSLSDNQLRDFGLEVGAILAALQFPSYQSFTALQLTAKMLSPAATDKGLRTSGCSSGVKKALLDKYSRLADAKTILQQLLAPMTQPQGAAPLLKRRSVKSKFTTYGVYEINPTAMANASYLTKHLVALDATSSMHALPCMLPVPEAVRNLEAKELTERAALMQEFSNLQSKQGGIFRGFSMEPTEEEIVARDGPVLRWLRSLQRLRQGGRAELADRKEQLLCRCVTAQSPLIAHCVSLNCPILSYLGFLSGDVQQRRIMACPRKPC